MTETLVLGRIDGEGRLVEADPLLAGLHARAGGAAGGPIAVPQLAALARLARRLATPVARPVLAADGDEDLDLWVRARPDAAGVRLAIAGWRRRAPPPPLDGAEDAALDRVRGEADWTWEVDAQLRLIAISAAGLAAIGDPQGGGALTRLVALEEREGGGVPLLAALAEGCGFDDQIVRARGGGARYRLAGEPVVDVAGRLRGFRGGGFAIDPATAPAATLATAGDAFAARLDVALRAPLQRIVASAESIRERDDGPIRTEYEGYAGDIATAGRHLLGLVDDLVDLESVERPDAAIEREPIDLADLARRAAGLLAVRADDKRIAIVRPDEDATLPATGDFRRALQVLVNIVGNAVRFGPDGSTVTVAIGRRGNHPAAIVEDRGRGIAPADRERAFEKFERLGAREPGSGLGLYISRRLARAMGGDLGIEDADGGGARLVFTLPA